LISPAGASPPPPTPQGSDSTTSPLHRRHLDLVRLALAGPDPSAIQDDPEAREVLDELQEDVAILLLPMHSLEENAMMVNALQGASTIIAQNSLHSKSARRSSMA
jgi:trehalose synthase